MEPYRHTQIGWSVAAGTAAGLALVAAMTLALSPATLQAAGWMVAALFAVLVVAYALFATLTVEVAAGEVRVRFGVGIIRKSIAISDIRRCDLVRARIRWGWGLHWTPSGWLYNGSGREVVRLDLRGERAIMVGSDDAPALHRAIEALRDAALVRVSGER
jgi:hypothetical protein